MENDKAGVVSVVLAANDKDLAEKKIHESPRSHPVHHADDGQKRKSAARCITLTRTGNASGLCPADGKAARRILWTGR